MLFDLRGAGRRRTVKLVYLGLALLMFVGFVGFSVGSSISGGGGILDAITQSGGGSSNSGAGVFNARVQKAERLTRTDPKNAAAWASLARARFQLAGVGDNFDTSNNTFTAAGRAQLRKADAAWQHYLALNPKHPDDQVASVMVQAYIALNQPAKAVQAQEIVTQARPTAATYAQLAVYAYQAGQTRTGDLARDKAISLSPKIQRATLRSQLDQARSQATGPATSGSTSGSSSGG